MKASSTSNPPGRHSIWPFWSIIARLLVFPTEFMTENLFADHETKRDDDKTSDDGTDDLVDVVVILSTNSNGNLGTHFIRGSVRLGIGSR